MPCPARHMHLSRRRRCDHPPRLFLEHGSNKVSYDFAFNAITVASFKKLFSSRVKAVCGDSRFGGESESEQRTPQSTTEPQQSPWPAGRDTSPYSLQQPHDAHAMSIPPQSCSLYPEEKRAPCLSRLTTVLCAVLFGFARPCPPKVAEHLHWEQPQAGDPCVRASRVKGPE